LEQVVFRILRVSLNEVVTDGELCVGEIIAKVFTLITAASQNGVNSEDRDSSNDKDRVHKGDQ
jgi:hypothetical protein